MTTPMMAQWHACKKSAQNTLLFFRMGDFYEAFYEDAATIAKELDLTLTKRQEIPMSGVPHHTCEGYIDRLVAKGYRVAVAEQTEDPKKTKGLVKREVVRVVTPGTVINSTLLPDHANNFFVAITQTGSHYGLASLDLSTGEANVIEFEEEHDLVNELHRLRPSECLTSRNFFDKKESLLQELQQSFSCLLNQEDDWRFDYQLNYDFLTAHFKIHSLDGFGLKGMNPAISASGALLHYLQETLCLPIEHVHEIHPYSTSQYMSLDRTSQANLELTESLQDGSRKNTLLDVLDKTHTPMGARLIRHWVKQPLLNPAEIHRRQDAVEAFFQRPDLLEQLHDQLCHIRDLERLIMKISAGYAGPRDLTTLRFSLVPVPYLQQLIPQSPFLQTIAQDLTPIPEVSDLIAQAFVDEPPARLSDGNFIRDGYHPELDELRTIKNNSKTWIAQYQIQLREETGIKTLKVGYNRMFGYYIEVSKGQTDKMPDTFQRRQTLVNAERYISPELKEYEGKVLTAEEKIGAIENELFLVIRKEVATHAQKVYKLAQALAKLDCLQSLATVARQNNYVRPLVDNDQALHITAGRHPVIEASNIGEKFIPNDTLLDNKDNRSLIITGPNMAGKSTYIRQVALITIMAQMGGFVPVSQAEIGVVDKIFTRIGASDNLSRGQSTFMVEMTETANILHNATSRSLVILDEIGRGTSTYDGISIAWSVAEYLLTEEDKMAKTLFATHYWELTKLEEKVPGAVNYNVAVHESDDNIVFLRKIVRGSTDKSYGIHVGRLAGLPDAVIDRAKEILTHLEETANQKKVFEPKRKVLKRKIKKDEFQLSFFGS